MVCQEDTPFRSKDLQFPSNIEQHVTAALGGSSAIAITPNPPARKLNASQRLHPCSKTRFLEQLTSVSRKESESYA